MELGLYGRAGGTADDELSGDQRRTIFGVARRVDPDPVGRAAVDAHVGGDLTDRDRRALVVIVFLWRSV